MYYYNKITILYTLSRLGYAGYKVVKPAVLDNLFEIAVLRRLVGKTPVGAKLNSLPFEEFTQLMSSRYIDDLGEAYAQRLNQIKAGLDGGGRLTEEIVARALEREGYNVSLDIGKYGTNNGYDIVAWKGTLENPSEIMIIEAKQFKQDRLLAEFDDVASTPGFDEPSGLYLNRANPRTQLPTQMSTPWTFDHVRNELLVLGGDQTRLATALENSQTIVERYVFAIDKADGAGYFARLANNF